MDRYRISILKQKYIKVWELAIRTIFSPVLIVFNSVMVLLIIQV